VWSGWQGDVPPGADRLTARFPTIPGITGMVGQKGYDVSYYDAGQASLSLDGEPDVLITLVDSF
jgi:hypothetical protein